MVLRARKEAVQAGALAASRAAHAKAQAASATIARERANSVGMPKSWGLAPQLRRAALDAVAGQVQETEERTTRQDAAASAARASAKSLAGLYN